MIKYLAIPLILVGCTAPVTDPPAHACSPRLDGKPTYCPDERDLILVPKPLLPREELKGEIDIYEPMHWHSINQMFIRNARRTQIEKNMTQPSDAINSALENFWEDENGSNDPTESEELLQLSGDGD